MNEAIQQALSDLFQAYLQSAAIKISLSAVADRHKISVMDLFEQLRQRELIKPDAIVDGQAQQVWAGISTIGIREHNPDYLNNQILNVLKGIDGNTGNVMGILNLPPSEFQRGFDIALEIQNRDYAKLLYSNYNANLIVIELSLIGKQKLITG